jgi:hypothetical protein
VISVVIILTQLCSPPRSRRDRRSLTSITDSGTVVGGHRASNRLALRLTHGLDRLVHAEPSDLVRPRADCEHRVWQEAFGQAWEALRTGNIAVGARVSAAGGQIACSAIRHNLS